MLEGETLVGLLDTYFLQYLLQYFLGLGTLGSAACAARKYDLVL